MMRTSVWLASSVGTVNVISSPTEMCFARRRDTNRLFRFESAQATESCCNCKLVTRCRMMGSDAIEGAEAIVSRRILRPGTKESKRGSEAMRT